MSKGPEAYVPGSTRGLRERLHDLVVKMWPIDKLLPYARNARTHSEEQVAQVAASMVEFGWTNPILASADGSIIAGHARLAAARKLGMTEVPVIVLDHLTETQRRALVLADTVETHGLECGPYEHFLDEWYSCPACGAKFAIEDLERTQ